MSNPLPHQSWMDAQFQIDQYAISPTDRERIRYEDEMRRSAERTKREILLKQRAIGLQNQILKDAAHIDRMGMGGNLANQMQQAMQNSGFSQNDIYRYLSGNRDAFMSPPNFSGAGTYTTTTVSPPALDEVSERADEAQKDALAAMNPLARFKFQELFKILEIKVRFTNMARAAGGGTAWILAKMGADGKMIRQEWSAPSKDPGCSLRTWEAMMGELMDEITRRKGIHVETDTDNSVAGTGSEGSGSSTGNT